MHICLIGNTGSGKTTLAEGLAQRLGLPVVSSGSIARKLSASDPATRLALQQGAMAPEQAMRAEVRMQIEAAEATQGGWVLDGFPRSMEQLVCLAQWSPAMPTYLSIDVSDWTCVERLTSRGRDHDNPDAIVRRLRHYDKAVLPMLAVLAEAGMVVTLDGRQSPGGLLSDAMRELS